MDDQITLSTYVTSWQKRLLDITIASVLSTVMLPLIGIVGLVVLVSDGWPIFFVQKRVGMCNKIFRIYKFRTMRVGADKEQDKYSKFNEVDGPVFKIRNDPRFVGVGRWLSHSGLDELPQLINVLKGEMSLVGPRPLPVKEFLNIPGKYHFRNKVRPGVCSRWQVIRKPSSTFITWMKIDVNYLQTASLQGDCAIMIRTVVGILKSNTRS